MKVLPKHTVGLVSKSNPIELNLYEIENPNMKIENEILKIRSLILESCFRSGGHISTSLSCVEILWALYKGSNSRLNLEKVLKKNDDRDFFVMSKGHGENALYALLVVLGLIPESWLTDHYRKGEFKLGGHVDSSVPGVEVSTGSLGHGPSVACGAAFAKKIRGLNGNVYCLIGDAECSEGSVWEAVIFAVSNHLDNLTFIIDNNKIGSLDYVENYINFDRAKAMSGFGAEVHELDGHDVDALSNLLSMKQKKFRVIVANTIKGKGLSIIENDPAWHVRKVDAAVYDICRNELGNWA
jgi:transketolase